MIAGKNVVVTGIVPGHSRGTAQAFLQDAGAYVQSSMSGDTEILVVGAKPGPKKIDKARSLGITVLTWEDMLAGQNGSAPVEKTEALTQARVVAPQLALAGDLPSGAGWLYEVKWDGYRCVATVIDGQVAMQSRSGRSEYVDQFPKVARELAAFPNCILDGELVVLDPNGKTSFETAHTAATGVEAFIVFDVLEWAGEDVRGLSLEQRKEILDGEVRFSESVTQSPVNPDGEALMSWVKENSQEGVVAKRLGSRYVEGSRTDAWIKVKVRLEQEFVVIGYIEGEGGRAGAAGSLLLAVRDGDRWVFCGRVGTGGEISFWRQFTSLPTVGPPGDDYDLGLAPAAELRDVVWLEPNTVVQVQFQRWTKDGRLWHPSVQRIRTDKNPLEVVRET